MSSTSGKNSARSSGSARERRYPENKREYFRRELKRLEEEYEKQGQPVKKPEQKEFTPDVFNDLEPYKNTRDLRMAVERPDDVRHYSVSRNTAGGPCDPWVSLRLDTDFSQPIPSRATNRYKTSASGSSTARSTASSRSERDKKDLEDKDKSGHKTSIYPIVVFYRNEFTEKSINYGDVPKLRYTVSITNIENTYSEKADKKNERDYKKTKAEFRRRGLNNMTELTPNSRQVLRRAYFAYLQNSPGSAAAVRECVREEDKQIRKKNKNNNKEQNTRDKETSRVSRSRNEDSSSSDDDDTSTYRSQRSVTRSDREKENRSVKSRNSRNTEN